VSDTGLRLETTDGVARLTIDRPDARNALSRALNLDLAARCRALAVDPGVRVVVVTGAGEQAFSAGADLKERKGVPASEAGPFVDAIAGAIEAVAALPQPTIAALGGVAFGGGLELALACDFRIAAAGVQLGLTEVMLGIMPGAGGTVRLARLIGPARAKQLILTGRRIDAEAALALGVVDRVVPRAELGAAVDGLVAELLRAAPISVRQAKEAIDRGVDLPLADALRLERACYDVTVVTADRDEGLLAFAEKRAPRWSGR
jgi:enoyl-CoA hydratase/carnithine racemase